MRNPPFDQLASDKSGKDVLMRYGCEGRSFYGRIARSGVRRSKLGGRKRGSEGESERATLDVESVSIGGLPLDSLNYEPEHVPVYTEFVLT